MNKVTEKNTKAEILDVVRQQEQKIAELQSNRVNIAEEAKQKVVANTIEKAEEIAGTPIEIKLNEVGTLITNALTDVLKKLEDKKVEYDQLCDGVKIMQQEIEEVSQIKTGVYTLAAIVNAETELKAKYAKDKEIREAELNAELNDLKKQIKELESKRDAEEKEYKANKEKERKNENEEFNYNLTRSRKLEEDKWTDEKNQREKELTDKESAVAAKEANVIEREKKVTDLETQVANIPNIVEKAVADAVEKAEKAKDKEYAIKETYSKKAHEVDLDKLNHKINFLEEADKKKDEEIKELKQKLNEAYAEIKNVAIETVKGAHTANIAAELKSFMATEKNNQK